MKSKLEMITKKKVCKIVVGGDGAVGKTTLCSRLAGTLEHEREMLMTCGVEFHDLKVEDGTNNKFEAEIWDLGGQEHFRFMQDTFYEKLDIAIFVYSVEWFHSFVNIDFWLGFLENRNPLKVYLVANKIDSEDRDVKPEEGNEFARARNMEYFEVSALHGEGFERLKNDIINTIKNQFC